MPTPSPLKINKVEKEFEPAPNKMAAATPSGTFMTPKQTEFAK